MGQLHEAIDLKSVVNKYNINTLIETGTGYGSTVSRAAEELPDLNIYTIESEEVIYLQAASYLSKYPNIVCLHGISAEILPGILKEVEGNILFWLDAHFPGADFGFAGYGDTYDKRIRIPLESELRLICENKNAANDIFLIDDLRIYEDGPFESGNWNERYIYGGDGIQFVYDLLETTHNIARIYSQQGYIFATPQ